MEKVIRDGLVAVLYSRGYGAGWYTWNSGYKQCLFHPVLIEMVEQNRQSEINEELMKTLLNEIHNKDFYFYCGGNEGLTIEWLPEGTAFNVEEYDGAEYIRTIDDLYITA